MCIPIPALGLATGLQTFSTVLGVGSTVLQTKAAGDQAAVNRRVAENNATLADRAAQDSIKRGEEEAADIRRRAAGVKSSQRVALAAHGLDLGYGTAADLQDQTDFFAEADVATTRTNARQDAWNRRMQGENYKAEARASSPGKAMFATALTGAGKVADRWYSYKGKD